MTLGVNRLWHRDDPICHSRGDQLSTGEPTFQQRQWNRLSHCHVFHILLPVDSVWGFLSRLNWGFDFIFAGTKWITITGKILLQTFGWEKLVISDIYFTPMETFLSTRSRFANNFRLPIYCRFNLRLELVWNLGFSITFPADRGRCNSHRIAYARNELWLIVHYHASHGSARLALYNGLRCSSRK